MQSHGNLDRQENQLFSDFPHNSNCNSYLRLITQLESNQQDIIKAIKETRVEAALNLLKAINEPINQIIASCEWFRQDMDKFMNSYRSDIKEFEKFQATRESDKESHLRIYEKALETAQELLDKDPDNKVAQKRYDKALEIYDQVEQDTDQFIIKERADILKIIEDHKNEFKFIMKGYPETYKILGELITFQDDINRYVDYLLKIQSQPATQPSIHIDDVINGEHKNEQDSVKILSLVSILKPQRLFQMTPNTEATPPKPPKDPSRNELPNDTLRGTLRQAHGSYGRFKNTLFNPVTRESKERYEYEEETKIEYKKLIKNTDLSIEDREKIESRLVKLKNPEASYSNKLRR